MSSIPPEIEEEILLRLPVKTILRVKSVCKSWYNLLCSLKFVNHHLTLTSKNPRFMNIYYTIHTNTRVTIDNKYILYSIDYASISSASSSSSITCNCEGAVPMDDPTNELKTRSIRMYGSCNGLLCVGAYKKRTLILWNPCTKESKKIIPPSFISWPDAEAYGFGYERKINDYKFVCLEQDGVYVYTLGSDLWRRVDTTTTFEVSYGGLHLNGVLHWLVSKVIVAFDLSSETFMNLHFPEKTMMPLPNGSLGIKLLGDSLCLVCGVPDVRVDVWVMQNYGMRESWTKQFTITHSQITKFPFFLKFHWSFDNGEILIQTLEGFRLYDQENDRVRLLNIYGANDGCYSVNSESYVESLVSLNSTASNAKYKLNLPTGYQ